MRDIDVTGLQAGGDTASLIGLLTEQRDLYQQLSGLAEHQRSLIEGNQGERLLAVLGQRQKLIDRLGELADRLRPVQQVWQTVRPAMSASDGERVDRLITEVNDMLSAILEKDQADVSTLAARKGTTATAVTRLKTHRAAGAAYAAAAGAAVVERELDG